MQGSSTLSASWDSQSALGDDVNNGMASLHATLSWYRRAGPVHAIGTSSHGQATTTRAIIIPSKCFNALKAAKHMNPNISNMDPLQQYSIPTSPQSPDVQAGSCGCRAAPKMIMVRKRPSWTSATQPNGSRGGLTGRGCRKFGGGFFGFGGCGSGSIRRAHSVKMWHSAVDRNQTWFPHESCCAGRQL